MCLSSTGGYHWHLVRALPLLDEAGRVTRWFGTCTDIQEQKAVEDELRRANEDLNQFAYSASHDLQEPLRMIASYTQLLHRRYGDKLDSAAETYIGYTVEGVKRMQALLADLLAYTQAIHVETADGEIADAQEALDKVWSNLRETRAASGAEIRTAGLPHVRMNEAHLVQVFQNLISNAIKYRGPDPPVSRIGAARRGTHWEFSVRDNGIGIAPRYATQVFGIFKRLHSSATLPGTGIGLAICQKIVERYGGRIWVESEGEGKGSTFFFTVPATDAGV